MDIGAGVFTALSDSSHSVASCVRQACNRRAGDVAFLVEKNCYMVRCHSKTSCRTKKPDTPSAFIVSITPYTWFGKFSPQGRLRALGYWSPINQLFTCWVTAVVLVDENNKSDCQGIGKYNSFNRGLVASTSFPIHFTVGGV